MAPYTPDTLIASDPDVMLGKPVIVGTRVTVESVLERLAAGETHESLTASHPALTMEAIGACLHFAAKALHAGMVYPVGKRA